MLTEIVDNRYAFYQITGETPETFIELLTFISLQPSREQLLSQWNRLLMFIIWLRMYPTYYFLSNLFSISVPVVGREITNILPLFCKQVKAYLVWPTVAEWLAMSETWAKLPSAVGAIDGTSHRIIDQRWSHKNCIILAIVTFIVYKHRLWSTFMEQFVSLRAVIRVI